MLKTIRILFYIILALFLLDIFELFQTKVYFLKTLIYYSVFILSLPLFIMEFKTKKISEPILRKGIPFLTIIGLIFLNPAKILSNTTTWKTQTIKLVNRDNKNHKVELQIKNLRKRNAEVYYLTDHFFFILAEEYDERNFLGHYWESVDKEVIKLN